MAERLDYDFTVTDRGTSTLAKGAAGLRELDRAGDKARRGSLDLADAQLKVRAAMVAVSREEGRVADARRKLAAVTKNATATDGQRRKATLDLQSAEVRHAQSLLGVQRAGEAAARPARDAAAATDDTGRAHRRAADTADDSAKRQTRAFGTIRAGARGMGVAVGVAMGGIGLATAAAAGGVLLLVGQVRGWLEEARDAAKVGRLTAAAIDATGGAAKVTRKEIEDYAERLSNLIGVDDEAIQSGQNLLLRFRNIRNEVGAGNRIFDRATDAAVNMTAALNNGEVTQEKLAGTVMRLGRALNDPVKGMTALSRSGVTFTKQQREQVAAMVKTGDVIGAQRLILKALEDRYAGTARAGADATQRLSVVWANVKETLGTAVLPVVEDLADWLSAKLPGAAASGAARLREWGPQAFGWWKENWPAIKDGFLQTGEGMIWVARISLGLAQGLAGAAAAGLYVASALTYAGAAAAYLSGNIDQGVKLQGIAKGLQDSAGRAIEFGNAIQTKTNPMLDAMQTELHNARNAADKLPGSKVIYTSAPGAKRTAAEINDVRQQAAMLPRSKTVDINIRSNAAAVVAYIRGQLNSIQDRTTYHTTVLRTVRAMQEFPSGGHAAGTGSSPPGWFWVGEEGPELVRMRGGEQVLPADVSSRVGMSGAPGYAAGTGWSGPAGAGGGLHLHFHGPVVASSKDALVRMLKPALVESLRQSGQTRLAAQIR